ncbi:MAG: hypothetical protein LAO20_08310 [Acidobacteriia bacterium]|nr:hypothetical protein [Terriglobia bacterium]
MKGARLDDEKDYQPIAFRNPSGHRFVRGGGLRKATDNFPQSLWGLQGDMQRDGALLWDLLLLDTQRDHRFLRPGPAGTEKNGQEVVFRWSERKAFSP